MVLILALLAFASPAAEAQSAFSAAAFVNDAIITQYDVDQRAKLLTVAGAPKDDGLRALALRSLIDEKLKREAGKIEDVSAPQDAIDQAMETFARSLRVAPDKLEARLKSAGVSSGALRDFLETDVIWGGVIRKRYGSRANVTEADVDAEIAESGLTEKVTYNLGELSMPDGANPAANLAKARKIAAELRAGANFQDQARTHSRSPTREKGGVVGWVPADRLPPDIAKALEGLEAGGVTDPIKVRGGVAILTVFDKRVEEVTINGETREGIRRRLISQRLEGYANTYLEELRSVAYIEEK
jgi:peptidyl-prolyl cis-trans isomerase SurA